MLMSVSDFQELVRRVRVGDESAAEELVRRFEPHIRRVVRFRLTDPELRAVFDSTDIMQSVLANFFARAGSGEFDLETPEHLKRLLAVMVRNKIISKHRKEQVRARLLGRIPAELGESVARAGDATPSELVAWGEMEVEIRRRLNQEEGLVAERRSEGRSWEEIAEEFGGSADAWRMRLSRAYDRVSEELGLKE